VPATVVTESVEQAAAFLRRGALVAFPTETVYGLGADAFDESAIRNIFKAKGRPADNPMIVHVLDASSFHDVASEVPPLAALLLEKFAPGPIAVIVPRADLLPAVVSGGLDSVAVRIPSHPTARALLAEFGGPIAAPSANVSGRPSPTTWQSAKSELAGKIDCVLAGPPSTVGLESTVVDCRGKLPVILRHGFVTAEQIAAAVGVHPGLIVGSGDAEVVVGVGDAEQSTRSPGTRHRHYAPNARVVIVDAATRTADFESREDAHGLAAPGLAAPATSPRSNTRRGFIGLDAPDDPTLYQRIRICRSEEEYASELYSFFRACEGEGITEIHCASVPPAGIGRALMDRLTRAAAATG
jgi:L-threonylcarbamoyladenylate synthase